jgi:hypothetical protein
MRGMDLRERFERRVPELMVAHVLESIAEEPHRRSAAGAGDLPGQFDYWFDGGAAKIETGYVEYRFVDGTKAIVGNPIPALSISIEFPNGCWVRVQQETWGPEAAG